jgi:hypothetical protein
MCMHDNRSGRRVGKKGNKQRGFLSNICLSQNATAFLAH